MTFLARRHRNFASPDDRNAQHAPLLALLPVNLQCTPLQDVSLVRHTSSSLAKFSGVGSGDACCQLCAPGEKGCTAYTIKNTCFLPDLSCRGASSRASYTPAALTHYQDPGARVGCLAGRVLQLRAWHRGVFLLPPHHTPHARGTTCGATRQAERRHRDPQVHNQRRRRKRYALPPLIVQGGPTPSAARTAPAPSSSAPQWRLRLPAHQVLGFWRPPHAGMIQSEGRLKSGHFGSFGSKCALGGQCAHRAGLRADSA